MVAIAGLLIFLAGFAIGAVEEVPSPAVLAGAAVVVVVVILGIITMVRMRGPGQ